MSSAVLGDDRVVALGRAHGEVDELLAADLTRLDGAEVLDVWRGLERLRNRLAAVEHRLLVEAERRGLPGEHGARDVAGLLRGLLRVAPGEARTRVHAADAAAGRMTITGQPTPAPFPKVAAAQADGSISPRHSRVVVTAVEGLSDELQAEHGERVEQELTDYARIFDPFELGKLALRITTLLDQDGKRPNDDEAERRRGFAIHTRPDGTSRMVIDATAELTERVLTTLDPLAAPKSAEDGTADPRSARQRRHDGLLDALNLLGRTDRLPDTGGISTTVLLTMTAEAWQTGRGTATTGHGAVIPAREAIRIADSSTTRVSTVRINPNGAICDWTDPRRLFTETQRLAMIARDGGCSFPACDVPPAWCQAHHVVEWTKGGPTTVDNGTMLCGFHHREFDKLGWSCRMINSRPTWIPPFWIDPAQKPRSNRFHQNR